MLDRGSGGLGRATHVLPSVGAMAGSGKEVRRRHTMCGMKYVLIKYKTGAWRFQTEHMANTNG